MVCRRIYLGGCQMKGKYDVLIQNSRLQFKFTLERNITILRGNSATGKTTMIDLIYAHQVDGRDSGVTVSCAKPCVVLGPIQWELNLRQIKDSIVFIDEGSTFVTSEAFAQAVKNSDNYYVIVTRVPLYMLPYSIREVYGMRNGEANKYQGVKRLYHEFYPLHERDIYKIDKPDCVVVEDSNAGYEFFAAVCARYKIPCISAGGKSNIRDVVSKLDADTILVIADGAAFGAEMEKMLTLKRNRNLFLYLPESFEWLVLKSGIVQGVQGILEEPSEYIESEKYFSWERFFTDLLVERTKDTYLQYSKKSLNPVYIHEKEESKILNVLPDREWE